MTNHTENVSPALSFMASGLNNVLPDETRQQLLPLVPLMAGTAGDGLDEARSYMALDWLVRTYAPTWLDLAGLTDHADALRSLDPITGPRTLQVAHRGLREVRERATDKWTEIKAESPALGIAQAAAWEAVDSSAWSVARTALWNSGWGSAWNDARSVVWHSAGIAVRNAARNAAQNAVRIAAWRTAQTAYDQIQGEVTDSVRTALAPTIAHLQDSAIQLLRAMIRPTA